MICSVKVLAFYLPQFHEVPENNRWWGDGFTEWTAVRQAIPRYAGHQQPVRPLHNNYYNLLDKDTMLWQANLAKKNGIHGMAFYHYWFKDGRKILEKPAENLLKWQDVDMPFCFNWANETWARTWSNLVNKNSWTNSYESDLDEREDGVLLDQKYGEEKDWLEHIEYLLPFFQDERYIRKDGKPVFIIYKPEEIPCISDIKECWERYLFKHNISGVFFIGGIDSCYKSNIYWADCFDAFYLMSPRTVFDLITPSKVIDGIKVFSEDAYWKCFFDINKGHTLDNRDIYQCVVNGYDDTPRHGCGGTVLKKFSLDGFKTNFDKVIHKAAQEKHEFVFFNAWNEWGEGMYLEPDVACGDGYLKMIKSSLEDCFCDKNILSKNAQTKDIDGYIANKLVSALYRDSITVKLMDKWLTLKEKGVSMSNYLLSKGIKTVAIYGYGYLGRHLYNELKDSCISVKYIIDKNDFRLRGSCPVYHLKDCLPEVDAIIVTPSGQYCNIKKDIMRYVNYQVLSLEHILVEC